MPSDNTDKTKHRIGFAALFTLVTLLHFLVTFVVILFLLSTLTIANRTMFGFERLDFIEMPAAAVMFILSARLYLRSFKKISLFIKTNFFPDLLS